MRRSRFSRLIGVVYVVGAVFGLVISLGGMVLLWTGRQDVTEQVTQTAALVGRALDATNRTVQVVNDSLDRSTANLELIRDLISDVSGTLDDSTELITSTSSLIGTDMVGFVEDTQASLQSVETSARLVDDFLRVISSVPLIGRRYRPEVPLQEAVADVNESLNPLPESFQQIQRQLDVASAHAGTMQTEIDRLAGQVDEIETSLTSAREVGEEYRLILVDLRDRWDRLEERLPLWLRVFYLGVTTVLIWMLVTQLGMLLHGLEMLTSPRKAE